MIAPAALAVVGAVDFPPPDPERELLKHATGVVTKVTDGKLRMKAIHVAGAVLDAVEDGWAKVGGAWVRLPDGFTIELP
jgi:hypothetical protein